ncbi:multiple monosaccharide ABC transporter ATP-binding protein [Alkalicoccus daliensis]|uniref:Multiple monosaccharide ABC transporter ATP-binding protein n=1 Tax=Alkalicoccus daliensis TaxID=745820 RepID=A0A1H0DP07_9BACI|nr:multiple monosaccharide ABC transporter ATP-binding protein [Alkalicoccus daliensis]SDN71783.1 multiple monosaccharide ABC transporter ATP-binding protein [Alkalicoccus daliensis]
MTKTLLEMKKITKRFPGVKALDNVNIQVKEGSIHALIGENGAGKSTLMKVLSGVYPYGTYEGDILYDEEVCTFKNINESEAKGIVIIHQELALIPELSIAENIFLGNEQASKGIVNWNETIKKTVGLLEKVGLKIDPLTKVKDIGVGQQQLVEISKALSKNVDLLILDEPTASLNETDSKNLLQLLREFQKQGMTSILISHKLKELLSIADEFTILRDGQTVAKLDPKKETVDQNVIIKNMVGRELTNLYPERHPQIGEINFEIKDWSAFHPLDGDRPLLTNINLNVHKGEIVGLAGLMGAGRTELAMSVFGRSYGRGITGKVIKDGKEINVSTVDKAIENGLAYVSEDRKEFGLILMDSVRKNLSIANLKSIAKRNVLNLHKEVKLAESLKEKMNVKTPSIEQITGNLSGGNQQKVVLGKWINTNPDVLILDEPTRGIDVGAKFEIYKLINDLAESGKSIIVISSELPELLGISDRIYTLNEGKITGELPAAEADQEKLMTLMTKSGGSN